MAQSRLELLEKQVKQFPREVFPHYGLAMEYRGAGRLDDAIRAFHETIELDRSYGAAYYQLAQTYLEAKRPMEAKEAAMRGLEATKAKGDMHTFSELKDLLAQIGA